MQAGKFVDHIEELSNAEILLSIRIAIELNIFEHEFCQSAPEVLPMVTNSFIGEDCLTTSGIIDGILLFVYRLVWLHAEHQGPF